MTILAVAIGLVVVFAWIDGGKETQRMIEQPVDLQEAAQ